MMQILPIPCFTDNYIWCLHDGRQAWVVDPGEADAVTTALQRLGLGLEGILVTHHHADHVGGVDRLNPSGRLPVIGPAEAGDRISQVVRGGESIDLPLLGEVRVIAVGAHTLGHVAFHLPALQAVFCGDALFSAGCGRLFEGTPADLQASLDRLAALPDTTRLYPAHEYTESNLRFARHLEPDEPGVVRRQEAVRRMREAGLPSLPSTLGTERESNPFLRTGSPALRATLAAHLGREPGDSLEVLAAIRAWKDVFRG